MIKKCTFRGKFGLNHKDIKIIQFGRLTFAQNMKLNVNFDLLEF